MILTPAMLAERWHCSAQTVRKIAGADGTRLKSFRLGGRLLRFNLSDIEEYERWQNTASAVSEVDGSSSLPTPKALDDDAIGLSPRTRARLIVSRRASTPT